MDIVLDRQTVAGGTHKDFAAAAAAAMQTRDAPVCDHTQPFLSISHPSLIGVTQRLLHEMCREFGWSWM
jgi:hypothetical protein